VLLRLFFSAIYAAKNSRDPYPYFSDISHEHLPELCIHHYVRSHLVPELPELKRCCTGDKSIE
jgi:hypothetical protein